jgi:FMN phosphatase YigB (HAD superfamily)
MVADGQCFTLVQLVRGLSAQGTVPPLKKLFSTGAVSLSYEFGVRQPSETLFRAVLRRFAERDIPPESVLHVASRLRDELAPAKKLGMRTALYAGDRLSLEASSADVNNPALRPDRILTDLRQMRQILKEPE